jgi:hypothetical protein
MSKTLLSFSLFASILVGSAAVAHAQPKAGSYELRLNQAFIPGFALSGLNVYIDSQSTPGSQSSDSLKVFAAGAGLGYFLTNNVEVGGTLNLLYFSVGDGSFTSPGVSPFLRYFGRLSDRVAGYVEGTVLVQPLFAENDDSMLWGFGADAGIERFFTESWALRIGAGYNYLNIEDDSLHALGARWALAAYF